MKFFIICGTEGVEALVNTLTFGDKGLFLYAKITLMYAKPLCDWLLYDYVSKFIYIYFEVHIDETCKLFP